MADYSESLLVVAGAFFGGVAAYSYARSKYLAFYIKSTNEHVRELNAKREEARGDRERAASELDVVEKRLVEARRAETEAAAEARKERQKDADERAALAKRAEKLDERETRLAASEAAIREREVALAGMTRDELRESMSKSLVDEVRRRAQREAKRIEDEAREESEQRATRLLAIATQRMVSRSSGIGTTLTFRLPSEEMKGRIIGREGRNIRALQETLSVDIVIDDTPEVVTISSFDPKRREIARLTLAALVEDGKIHPSRIEEAKAQAIRTVDEATRRAVADLRAEFELDPFPAEVEEALGTLRFLIQEGENVLAHCADVARLTAAMAAELPGQDVRVARRAGLLHDIGKAIKLGPNTMSRGHAAAGAELLSRAGESEVIVSAARAHHGDTAPDGVISALVAAAEAIVTQRPGARRDTVEGQIKRMEALEHLAQTFDGVVRAYAISAGRELRVIVEPSQLSDEATAALAREIAQAIEKELTYSGQIRIVLIREYRATETAR